MNLLTLLVPIVMSASAHAELPGNSYIIFEGKNRPNPMAVTVRLTPQGLEVSPNNSRNDNITKKTITGLIKFFSMPTDALNYDIVERQAKRNQIAVADAPAGKMVSIVGKRLIYFDGKKLIVRTINSLDEREKVKYEIAFDENPGFAFHLLVTDEAHGDGRIYVFTKDGEVLESASRILELENATLGEMRLRDGNLRLGDRPAIKMRNASRTGAAGRAGGADGAGPVQTTMRILDSLPPPNEGEADSLGTFIDTTFDVIRKPIAGYQSYAQFQGQLQTATVAVNMNSAGGIVVMGDPRSGKSYFMDTLASYLVEKSTVPMLLVRLDAARLVGGGSEMGVVEQKILALKKASEAVRVVLFIENCTSLEGAGVYRGNNTDFFDHIQREISRGSIKIVCEATPEQFAKFSSTKPAVAGSFVFKLRINPPSKDKVFENMSEIIHARANKIATAPGLPEKVAAIARRFDRLGLDLDKTKRLLEFALEMGIQNKKPELNEELLKDYASLLYGLNIRDLEPEKIRFRVAHLVEFLDSELIGMNEAKQRVTEGIGSHLFHGLNSSVSTRPLSFLFYGPKGVGKTALAMRVAEGLGYPAEKKIPMSAYNTPDKAEAFLAYLAQRIQAHPISVIFLDELDKSDRKVQQTLLQVLDEGKFKATLTEGAAPVEVDAGGVIFMMSTNAGQNLALSEVTDVQYQAIAEKEGLDTWLLDRISMYVKLAGPTREQAKAIVIDKWNKYKKSLEKDGYTIHADHDRMAEEILAKVDANTDTGHISVRQIETKINEVVRKIGNYFITHPEKSVFVDFTSHQVEVGSSPIHCTPYLLRRKVA